MAKLESGNAHRYTVIEAQNLALGQSGVAFLSDTSTYTPPTGQLVIAIQFVSDTLFDSATVYHRLALAIFSSYPKHWLCVNGLFKLLLSLVDSGVALYTTTPIVLQNY